MKIVKFDIFQYRLPLLKSIAIHGKTLKLRKGFIIKLTNEHGISGFGEIAPLPVLSKENLKMAQKQILSLRKVLIDSTIPKGVTKLSGKFELWLKRYRLSSSVRCGIEMAVLNLLGNTKQTPFCRLVNPLSLQNISINGLLEGTETKVLQEARGMIKHGFRSIKLKVGNTSVDEDIEKVNTLKKIIHRHARLRLDANQNWALSTAIIFGKKIGTSTIEYIEEPLYNSSQITKFFTQTKLPVALDENLNLYTPREIGRRIRKLKGVKAIIIKPTLLGGFERSMQFIRAAKKLKIQTVISSSFESGIGLIALANFAACVSAPHISAGLDTIKWFKEDLLADNRILKQPNLKIDNLFVHQQNNINTRLLKKLSYE